MGFLGSNQCAAVCLILAAVLTVQAGAVAQSAPTSAQQTSATGVPTAERRFKNIQVLKDIPSDQLIPAMQFITASLGVECGFCHVENHFDQDDKKPKQIARKMMLMMAAINQNNFDGHREVTCNTCHRGARVPVGIPVISEGVRIPGSPNQEGAQLPPNLPSAQDLIKKYIASLGGEKAIARISTRAEKGNANFAGREIPVDIYDNSSSKRVTLMHLPNGDSITGFDGSQGWTEAPGHPAREMPASEIEGAKIDADLQFPLHITRMFTDLRPTEPENIDGHATYQLISENTGQPRIRLYFDQQTGLLVRLVRYGDSPLGLNPVRVDYDDYRPVDGVQVPYRLTIARPSGQFTVQVTSVEQNAAIDDSVFKRPTSLDIPPEPR